MKNEKVLIVSYRFGIENGVGGRRWFQYASALKEKGYTVHILTAKGLNKNENACRIFDGYHTIQPNYPKILLTVPKKFKDKVLYKLALLRLKIYTKGLLLDEVAFLKKKFMTSAASILENNNIENLIISGSPFGLLYYGCLLRKKNKKLNLLVDFRDLWLNGVGYGIRYLSPKRLAHETARERLVIETADHLIVASDDLKISLKKRYANIDPVVVYNAFNDKGKKDAYNTPKAEGRKEVIVTLIGSINFDTEKYWKKYFSVVEEINSGKENVSISTRFIGDLNKLLSDYVAKKGIKKVVFIPRMDEKKLAAYMAESDFFLFFKHDEFPHSFPTKFLEYIVYKKPLICFSKPGMVSEEILKNNLGFVFDETLSGADLIKKIESVLTNEYVYNTAYHPVRFMIGTNLNVIESLLK